MEDEINPPRLKHDSVFPSFARDLTAEQLTEINNYVLWAVKGGLEEVYRRHEHLKGWKQQYLDMLDQYNELVIRYDRLYDLNQEIIRRIETNG